MTIEEALLYMRIGGRVKHPNLPGKTLGYFNGKVRVVQNGFGFAHSFMSNKYATGWEKVKGH